MLNLSKVLAAADTLERQFKLYGASIWGHANVDIQSKAVQCSTS